MYARVQHPVEMRAHTLPVLEVLQIWPFTLIRRMGGQGAEGFESEGFENVPGFETISVNFSTRSSCKRTDHVVSIDLYNTS